LEHYKTSPLVTKAERAALDYATELTRNKKVDPDTFAAMARFYSEREICEIVWLVAMEGKVEGRAIVLIDDVMTSGATVNAASRALLRAGAKRVDVLAFARAI
jgi:hypoxanthine-guanine phosphoribosyltransferase